MTDKKLMRDIETAKKNRPFPILGVFIAVTSILYGEFIVRVEGYFISHAEPYLQGLPEREIGMALVILGIVKLLAIILKNYRWKRIAIVGLSAMWSGLFFVSLTYSFGTGFPNPSWIFMLLALSISLLESWRGDFGF